jgi:enediyne biosynthesis protein E4
MMQRTLQRTLTILAMVTALAPFAARGQDKPTPVPAVEVPVTVTRAPLAEASAPCLDTFQAHALPHFTAVAGNTVRMFDANGAGMAAGDLDGDGDLDLVFGNHDGSDSLLWNLGDLRFRLEAFSTGKTRDVKLVDVAADGRLDIVLTRNTGALNYFHNESGGKFERQTLPGIAVPAYATNWADLDQDGDLDLVAGTYDAGLLTDRGNEYLVNSGNKGIYYYENNKGIFTPQQLSGEAQALTILLPDLNADGRPDIMVGNDFLVPDMIWLRTDTGWERAEPFASTTHSTMSLDQGDIDNDGTPELFAADMKPYAGENMAAWAPVMDGMMEGMTRQSVTADRQSMENALQFSIGPGEYLNLAPDWGVDGTGWSWSSKFGDLDNDGWLDLYVVNGMMEETLFAHLPNHELVEKNQAFRNENGVRLRAMPGWWLDSTNSGRGMVEADFDQDGDLDIVVNNLRGPAQLFENQLCHGQSLELDLRWPSSGNTYALGALAILHTDKGALQRDVRAGSGYLSGDAPRLHFGFPVGTRLDQLEIRWPDGSRSVVKTPQAGNLLTVTR